MPPDLQPKFQLAFRRALFFFICLFIWIGIGTLAFSALGSVTLRKDALLKENKLDSKRSELLNVLWAETIAKSENDWAELANQKLEHYEKILLNHLGVRLPGDKSYFASMQKAFSLSSTIGPIDIDDFSTIGKIFAVVFAMIGAPLCLNVIAQCGKMISTLWQGRSVFLPTAIFIFISAVVYDVIEGGEDDVPFVDAIFSIFLQFTSIGEEDNEFHGIVPYVICILGLSLMSAAFVQMQHEVERYLHQIEFSFTNLFCKIARWIGEEKEDRDGVVNNNRIEEEDEGEESDY